MHRPQRPSTGRTAALTHEQQRQLLAPPWAAASGPGRFCRANAPAPHSRTSGAKRCLSLPTALRHERESSPADGVLVPDGIPVSRDQPAPGVLRAGAASSNDPACLGLVMAVVGGGVVRLMKSALGRWYAGLTICLAASVPFSVWKEGKPRSLHAGMAEVGAGVCDAGCADPHLPARADCDAGDRVGFPGADHFDIHAWRGGAGGAAHATHRPVRQRE